VIEEEVTDLFGKKKEGSMKMKINPSNPPSFSLSSHFPPFFVSSSPFFLRVEITGQREVSFFFSFSFSFSFIFIFIFHFFIFLFAGWLTE